MLGGGGKNLRLSILFPAQRHLWDPPWYARSSYLGAINDHPVDRARLPSLHAVFFLPPSLILPPPQAAGKKAEWVNVMKQEGLDDMTLLAKVTNDEICSNIKLRYDKDIIYVRCLALGLPALVSVGKRSLFACKKNLTDQHRVCADFHESL